MKSHFNKRDEASDISRSGRKFLLKKKKRKAHVLDTPLTFEKIRLCDGESLWKNDGKKSA